MPTGTAQQGCAERWMRLVIVLAHRAFSIAWCEKGAALLSSGRSGYVFTHPDFGDGRCAGLCLLIAIRSRRFEQGRFCIILKSGGFGVSFGRGCAAAWTPPAGRRRTAAFSTRVCRSCHCDSARSFCRGAAAQCILATRSASSHSGGGRLIRSSGCGGPDASTRQLARAKMSNFR